MANRSPDPQVSFDLDVTGDNHFESLAKTNGKRYWLARDLMRALGYETWGSFRKVINKAIGVFMTMGFPVAEHFIQCTSRVEGKDLDDYKLSRQACLLTSLNGDVNKPNVAKAQMYLVALAEVLSGVPVPTDSADRILIRDEVSEVELALNKTVTQAGVEFYDRFQNAGYRGMYNMDYADLKRLKGLPDMRRSLLDFMGKDELAGNLFRLTLTEGRIRKDNVRGQRALENVAEQVGARVRQTIIEETGTRPETLPIGPDIKTVRKGVRSAHKGFLDMDDVPKERAAQNEAAKTAARDLALIAGGFIPECEECVAGSQYSHMGSPLCTSGALAAGGFIAHCDCDFCSAASHAAQDQQN